MSEKLSERFAAIQHDNFDCLDDLLPTTEIPSRNQFLALAALTTKLAGLVESLRPRIEALESRVPQSPLEAAGGKLAADQFADLDKHANDPVLMATVRALAEEGEAQDARMRPEDVPEEIIEIDEHGVVHALADTAPPCPFKLRDRVRHTASGRVGIVAGRHQDPHLLAVHCGDPWAHHWLIAECELVAVTDEPPCLFKAGDRVRRTQSGRYATVVRFHHDERRMAVKLDDGYFHDWLISECELAPALVWTTPPNTKGLWVEERGRYMVRQYGDDFAIDIPCESPPAWQVAQVIRRGMCSDAQQWCQQHADKAKERTA